jgi:hypothetical protein
MIGSIRTKTDCNGANRPDFGSVCCACKALWSNVGAIPYFFRPFRSNADRFPTKTDRFEPKWTVFGAICTKNRPFSSKLVCFGADFFERPQLRFLRIDHFAVSAPIGKRVVANNGVTPGGRDGAFPASGWCMDKWHGVGTRAVLLLCEVVLVVMPRALFSHFRWL